MFFSESKFYDRKESSLTKYYCIRSKLRVFLKFFTFSFNKKTPLRTYNNTTITKLTTKNTVRLKNKDKKIQN